MTHSELMKWRRLTPGALTLLFTAILMLATGRLHERLPIQTWGMFVFAALVLSAIYQITGLRNLVNKKNHEHVNETIRSRLVLISGAPDEPQRYTWAKVRPLFYDIIDNDQSLTVKSETIKSNGAIWTGFADATALAGIFTLVSFVLWKRFAWPGADVAFGIFIFLMILGIVGSLSTTLKHRKLADEQIDVIEFKYRQRVSDGMAQLG